MSETAAKSAPKPPLFERLKRSRRARWGAGAFGVLAIAILIFLAVFDWNWFRGPLARFASASLQRPVAIDGNLRVKLLTWSPTASVEGVRIGQPSWAPKGDMVSVRKITASIRLPALFTGHVVMPLLSVEQPRVDLLRDAQARANWDFGGKKKPGAKPLKLPPIQTFIIEDGRITARDVERKLVFEGVINAREQRSAAYAQGFSLKGEGSLNKNPFLMNITGGPLLNVRPDRPYPFDAEISAGPTKLLAKGAVPKPFDLGRIDASLTLQGKDLAALYDLTGVTLPNTPPYKVTGQFSRHDTRFDYNRFAGTIGASDIGGDMSVETGTGRLYLTGALKSKRLDFADLASVFGLPGASKAAAPDQKVALRQQEASGRLLPDAPLEVERLRSMDALVSYRADSVLAPNLPLKAVSVDAKLDKGVLTLEPVSFELPQGRLTGTARIDARGKVPESAIDFRVTNARIEDFLPKGDGPKPIEGVVMARIKLSGRGDSVRRAAAAADGAITGVIPQGQIRRAFAELLGINATKGLFLLLAEDQTPTPLRCAVADFRVTGGVMRADKIVLDTGPVTVLGEGTISLDDERYDLSFKGRPKKLRAVRLASPITVKGSLAKPAFGIDAAPAIAQAGIGVALASVLSPIAVILPFVDPGLAKDANCTSLLAEAQQTPSPVKAKPTVQIAREDAKQAAKQAKKGS